MGIFGWFKPHSPAKQSVGEANPTDSSQKSAGEVCTVRVCTVLEDSGFHWTWKLETPHRIDNKQRVELDRLVRTFCLNRYSDRPKTAEGRFVRNSEVIVPFVLRG